MSRCVSGIIIDKQDLAKRNSGRGNLRYERRDIFGLVNVETMIETELSLPGIW
jgi:hypothetical protein